MSHNCTILRPRTAQPELQYHDSSSMTTSSYETAPSLVDYPHKSGLHDCHLPASTEDLPSDRQSGSHESRKLLSFLPTQIGSHLSSPCFHDLPHSTANSPSLCPSPLSANPPSHQCPSISLPLGPMSFIRLSLFQDHKAPPPRVPDMLEILGDDASDKVLATYHEMASEMGEPAGSEMASEMGEPAGVESPVC
jgi:hypothetical protein